MSAEEEKDISGEEPAKKPVPKTAAKKSAAAKKPAASKKPTAEKKADGDEQASSEKKAPKKPAAKKAAGKKASEPVVAEKEAKPAVAPRRAAKTPRRRVVRAHARYVRTSARKARMVCGHLRGKTVGEARAILAFTPREVARDWSKLLESAVANAENNHELLEDDLVVREAYADEGPTIKRFRPRAMGRATPIHKRTSHLTITLTPGS